MKERPILFNDEMVRALFDGKSQTRRPCRIPTTASLVEVVDGGAVFRLEDGTTKLVKHSFGKSGDKLWVRECFYCDDAFAGDYDSVGRRRRKPISKEQTEKEWRDSTAYRADEPTGSLSAIYGEEGKWRPSIHMPRWASRTALDVLNVRPERVQDITEWDADAEGMAMIEDPFKASLREVFADVFDAIYGAGAFRSNPWIWRVDFERSRT